MGLFAFIFYPLYLVGELFWVMFVCIFGGHPRNNDWQLTAIAFFGSLILALLIVGIALLLQGPNPDLIQNQ